MCEVFAAMNIVLKIETTAGVHNLFNPSTPS